MVVTWLQGAMSAVLILFCMYLITVGNRTESAWTLLSSIIAYWMPSPTTQQTPQQIDKNRRLPS